MAFCGQCGTKFDDGTKFCPSCGAPTALPKETPPAAPVIPAAPAVSPVPTVMTDEAKDAQDNKVMAILAYFGPLVLIPILAAKDSKFARYHSNQGLVLLIALIGYNILTGVISAILTAISWRLYFIGTIFSFLGIAFTVLAVLGLINACKGEKKPLPFIGGFILLK